MAMTLTSPAFGQGGTIPKKYTCDGDGISPPLRWSEAPDGTRSLLVVCDDPDAPGTFYCWAAYDIPPTWRGLDEGHGMETLAGGFKQAINGFGLPGYAGQCPPHRDKPHAYHFRVSALSIESLPVGIGPTCDEVVALAQPYEIESAELVGFRGR